MWDVMFLIAFKMDLRRYVNLDLFSQVLTLENSYLHMNCHFRCIAIVFSCTQLHECLYRYKSALTLSLYRHNKLFLYTVFSVINIASFWSFFRTNIYHIVLLYFFSLTTFLSPLIKSQNIHIYSVCSLCLYQSYIHC